MPRVEPTSSELYGSIAGGSWNWAATAPDSRVKSASPVTAFHDGQRRAGALLDELRERPRLGQVEPRRDAVERLERERDLDQVGVAGPLAHPVDRPLHPGRAGLDGRDRRRRAEPEVVVAVPVHGDLAAEPVDGLADEVRGRLRRRDPDRVDDDDLLGAGLDRRLVGAPVEVELGPRGVDAEERDLDARRRSRTRPRCGSARASSRARPRAPASFASEIGLSITDAGTPSSTSASTSACTAREKPQTSARSPAALIELDRAPVLGRDAREARLDPVDPGGVERDGDLELLLRRQDDADRLLAVAQRRVVEADDAVRLRIERHLVETARPDLGAVDHACTIPSGKLESFSAPSPVIRKLSSTRKPPPPSQ